MHEVLRSFQIVLLILILGSAFVWVPTALLFAAHKDKDLGLSGPVHVFGRFCVVCCVWVLYLVVAKGAPLAFSTVIVSWMVAALTATLFYTSAAKFILKTKGIDLQFRNWWSLKL